ncbi:uncharacterized protein LOC131422042 [Diceros bicornis minor]|uniref:uncharacterized protein LOC131422042 n=1 Tax=Diceros bicornis minor TaxID=77932 RepID=UPI0026F21D95|nr:uncharacterized protein LOC131422042 [Diceros bicornis minor]
MLFNILKGTAVDDGRKVSTVARLRNLHERAYENWDHAPHRLPAPTTVPGTPAALKAQEERMNKGENGGTNGASDGPADRQTDGWTRRPRPVSAPSPGLIPPGSPTHLPLAPPRGSKARAQSPARRSDTHPPAAARERQRHPPASSCPLGRRPGKGQNARAGSAQALGPPGLVVPRLSGFPGAPHARLFRNYDFRWLRGRGAGLAATESLYVADRSLIGYVCPSLTVTFNGLCKREELGYVVRDRPQKKYHGAIGGNNRSRKRSVSAVRGAGTSARVAQSQGRRSFYKSLSRRR